MLVNIVNRNLSIGENINTPKEERHKMTYIEEIQQFYMIQMELENSYGKREKILKKHFFKVKEDHDGILPIGVNRFCTLRNALKPSIPEIKELAQMISIISRDKIVDCSVCYFLIISIWLQLISILHILFIIEIDF